MTQMKRPWRMWSHSLRCFDTVYTDLTQKGPCRKPGSKRGNRGKSQAIGRAIKARQHGTGRGARERRDGRGGRRRAGQGSGGETD